MLSDDRSDRKPIKGLTEKSYNWYNICRHCLKRSLTDLNEYPCSFCGKDDTSMRKHGIPLWIKEKDIERIEEINGKDVWLEAPQTYSPGPPDPQLWKKSGDTKWYQIFTAIGFGLIAFVIIMFVANP